MHKRKHSKKWLLGTACMAALSYSFGAAAQQDNAAQEMLNRTGESAPVEQIRQEPSKTSSPLDTDAAASTLANREGSLVDQMPSEDKLIALREMMAAEPNNLDHYFAFAQMATHLGELDSAASAYEAMLVKAPELDRVRLDLGATYIRLQRLEDARDQLQQVLDRDPPEAVQTNIKTILSQLDQELRENTIGGSVTFGLNYDTNANSAPNDGRIRIFDTPIPLSGDQLRQDDLQGFAAATLTHDYTPGWAKGESVTTAWQSLISYYQTEQSSVDSLNLKVFSIKTGPTFRLNESKAKIAPSISYNHITLDGHTYLRTLNAELHGEVPVSETVLLKATINHENRDFVNSPGVTTYTDRTGDASQLELGARIFITTQDFIDTGIGFRLEDARADYYTNQQISGTISYTKLFWEDYFANARLGYRNSVYEEPDYLLSSRKRHDKESSAGLTFGKRINDTVSATIGYQYRDVDSNIENYTYDNHRVLAAITARF